VIPLQDPNRDIIGVLQLINARNGGGEVVPFDPEIENLVQALASQAAVAIRNARLEELSFKDPLTGVYNRRYFALRTEEEAKRHARFAEPLSLVLLDIDHLKAVNDVLGHVLGDKFLKVVAQRLQALARDGDTVARLGGDEFAILQSRLARSEEAADFAGRIIAAVDRLTGQVAVAVPAGVARCGMAALRTRAEIVFVCGLLGQNRLVHSRTGGHGLTQRCAGWNMVDCCQRIFPVDGTTSGLFDAMHS